MQLKIFCSNTTNASHARLYDRLKQLDSPTAKHVFLVPDRFTLGVERDIIDNVFPEGFTRVDVASFTRFAVKTVGNKIKKCLSKEGTVVLLEKILQEKSESLKYFRKVKGYNFAKELFAAIASLRSAGINPDDLAQVAGANEGKFWDKISDVALVMREYEKFLTENYSDTITRIDSLIRFAETGAFSDVNFYVLGFNMYSAQQSNLLKALAKYGASLNIAVVKSRKFYDPSEEMKPLIAFCEENEIPVETEESFCVVDSVFHAVREGIFGGKSVKTPTDRIRVFEEATPNEEISAVAKEIVYLARRENYRYKDMAVVCNDGELLPYIRETFARCDIPCFVDEGYEVLGGVTVKYLIYLMEAMDEYSPEKVFRFMRHPFCNFTREEQSAFYNYCIKYNIRYDRFLSPFVLGDFAEAERIRKILCDRFILPTKGTMAEYCDILIGLLEGFSEISEKLKENPDARIASSGYTEKFSLLLTETKELIGERTTTIGETCGFIKSAAVDLKTVMRPDNYDVVFVGNTEESRFSDVKIMFIINACDGMFPQKSGDGMIFSMADNEALKRNGLSVFPTPVDRNLFAEYVVYDLLSKGMDRLYLSVATANLAGDVQYPGDAYKEIAFITDSKGKKLAEYHGLSEKEEILYFLATDKNAYKEYVGGTVPPKYRATVEEYLFEKGLLTKPEIIEEKTTFEKCFKRNDDGEFVTSVSQLENYFVCPFRHYLRYCLKVSEKETSAVQPSTLGTAIHNVLEVFFKNNLKKINDGDNLEREIDEAIEGEFSKSDYECFYTDRLSAHILQSTKKECKKMLAVLAENMRNSSFRPNEDDFEVQFGYRKEDNKISLTVNNYKFSLRGKIDRVDRNGNDIIIIDYKTGRVEPQLASVYVGEKIQLYVYLGYFVKKGGVRPAGAFYLPIKSGAKKDGNEYRLMGQMLKDGEVYRAIDNRCREEGKYSSPYLDFNVTVTDGEVKFNRAKNAVQSGDFERIIDYVDRLMAKGISEILEGYAEKKPLPSACKNCSYSSMCGSVESRKMPNVKIDDFYLTEGGENE